MELKIEKNQEKKKKPAAYVLCVYGSASIRELDLTIGYGCEMAVATEVGHGRELVNDR